MTGLANVEIFWTAWTSGTWHPV